MKEKRMTALWKPHIWPSLHRLQFVPHSAIPDGTVVWVKISAGRHIVQAALSQGRQHRIKHRQPFVLSFVGVQTFSVQPDRRGYPQPGLDVWDYVAPKNCVELDGIVFYGARTRIQPAGALRGGILHLAFRSEADVPAARAAYAQWRALAIERPAWGQPTTIKFRTARWEPT